MYRTGRGGETRGGKIDLQDIASRLERANDDSGRYMLEGSGPALLSGGLDPALFEADVKNITNGYEEELDHLLRSKGHQGMQPVSMTKMLETKKAEARKRPLSMAAAAAAKAARNAKALAADSQLQEEPSSSSLGSTQMGLSADTVKDGSQAVQFFATVDEEDEVMWRALPTPLRRMLADDGIVMLSALPREGPAACRVEVGKLLSLQPAACCGSDRIACNRSR
jgi:hypothetical protein